MPGRRPTALAGMLGIAVAAVVAAAGPAQAAPETYPVPPTGVYRVMGHGYGHGHGMSQYGARGAALAARQVSAILDGYYPGTINAYVSPTAPIRVRLMNVYPDQIQIQGQVGLTVLDGATGHVYSLVNPSHYRFRIVENAVGQVLQYSSDGPHWRTHPLGTGRPHPGALSFIATGPLRLVMPHGISRDYEGVLTAIRTGPTTVATVNTLTHEAYVAGVVGREMPASWPAAALQAQAVASRTYSAYQRAHAPAGRAWDICDTSACQVYGGRRAYGGGRIVDLEPAAVRAAVAATAGLIRTYQGAPIFAQFSASNGGYSAPGSAAYLAAQPDPYDTVGNKWRLWTHTVRAADVARCGGMRSITSVTVARDGHGDWGGRLVTLRLTGRLATGAAGYRDITGDRLRACFPGSFPSTYVTFW